MKKILYIPVFIASFWGCETYYEPETDPQPSYYVFDGYITDQIGIQTVLVTKSYNYSQEPTYDRQTKASYEKVTDAQVTIEEKYGRTIALNVDKWGYYRSDSTAGTINHEYRLHVIMADGTVFYSEYDKLLSAPPIDTIFGKYVTKKVEEIDLNGDYTEAAVDGISVFNSTTAGDYTPYYRYDCKMVYQSLQYYPPSPGIPEEYAYIFRPRTSLGSVFIGNSNLYLGKTIANNELQFMSRLIIKKELPNLMVGRNYLVYNQWVMVKVKQYALTEKAYNYWESISKQQDASSYLFDPIESQVIGNMYSASNPDDLVLGYFGASAVTQKTKAFKLKKSNEITTIDISYFPEMEYDTYYINEKPFFFLDF